MGSFVEVRSPVVGMLTVVQLISVNYLFISSQFSYKHINKPYIVTKCSDNVTEHPLCHVPGSVDPAF